MAKLIARRRACETLVSPRECTIRRHALWRGPCPGAPATPSAAPDVTTGAERRSRCRASTRMAGALAAEAIRIGRRSARCLRGEPGCHAIGTGSDRRPPPGARRAFSDATLCGNQIMGAAMRGSLCPIYANKPPLYGVKTFLTMITHIRCGPWSWVSNLQPARFAGAGFLMPRARTSSPRWAVKPLLNPEP